MNTNGLITRDKPNSRSLFTLTISLVMQGYFLCFITKMYYKEIIK